MGILPQASTYASRADQIFLAVFVLSLGFLVGITAVMIYFVVRYRRQRHPKAAQIEGHTALEITWTLIPLVLFVSIFYFGWTNYDYGRRAPRDAMVVKVTARQWSWAFEYPNGKQTTKLYAALNRPIKVEVNSLDVVHGFFVPAFRIKVDAVPGRTNTTWFQPTVLGSFDIQCTVICGVNHSAMLSSVEVVPVEAFKVWYFGPEGTPEPAGPAPADPAAAVVQTPGAPRPDDTGAGQRPAQKPGVALLRADGCLACHSLDGTPMTGPSFKGLFGKTETILRDGKPAAVTMDENEISLAIGRAPKDVVQGYPPMPVVNLTPKRVAALVNAIKQIH
ncbi:MAG: cytochrome c oxidase subunit II [Polyangiaceae bacterium]|nr:cytochrome c oxidase subunit II [Polyangiaceae bacterium]